jgi:cyclohexadieny/prephenate dehydrogenase
MIKHISIIGLGLIGGSIGRAVKQFIPHVQITGFDSSPETVERAYNIGFIDYFCNEITASVLEADLVIIAAPLGVFAQIAEQIIPNMKKGAILTDTGSVKQAVIDAIQPFLPLNPEIFFIPAHPIAGTEKSGVEAGFSTLFQNRMLVITPFEDTPQEIIDEFQTFWQLIGCQKPQIMSPKHHDLVFAIVSHIPHLIAYNIVGTANHLEQVSEQEVIRYAASGFRDFTRLASSDPRIWRDVFLNNREAVLEMLGRFSEDLTRLQRAIRYGDGQTLFDLFSETRDVRKKIIEAGQETASDNFGRNNN